VCRYPLARVKIFDKRPSRSAQASDFSKKT
jgi:hypothetical protein